jgi:hypothetical protein
VLALAAEHHVDLSGASIVDPRAAGDREEVVAELVRLRAHKGMTAPKAQQLLDSDFTWCGLFPFGVVPRQQLYTYCSTAALHAGRARRGAGTARC